MSKRRVYRTLVLPNEMVGTGSDTTISRESSLSISPCNKWQETKTSVGCKVVQAINWILRRRHLKV